MSNIAPLLDRNRAFAGDPASRRGMPRLPFVPNLNLYMVTCIDARVDPAQVLGLRLGDAVVQRDIGGRITPATIADIAYIGYLVDASPTRRSWTRPARSRPTWTGCSGRRRYRRACTSPGTSMTSTPA
ncbi:MAG TPA: hypothetical protein VMC03_10950 [Streptosporangiaceae bacterium]|nr:hypothetical protein [Streptosporangiaceae bacterium]